MPALVAGMTPGHCDTGGEDAALFRSFFEFSSVVAAWMAATSAAMTLGTLGQGLPAARARASRAVARPRHL